jgi:TolB-like protein/Tfp pilus assembly protein PilF
MVIAWLFVQRTPPRANISDAPDKSIAVLPFANLSDQQNAFFANGVQDEILTHLAKIADLKVISRTSVMSYTTTVRRNLREIGQQLGVAHVLEGSVQRSGNRVRVNAQLIDARTDSHLWAQTYDRDLADVFAIQTEIARAISDQLQAKLSATEKAAIEQPPTADLAAFDLYSRAKTLLTGMDTSDIGKNNLLKAVELLEQAIGRDPTFVQAYCQMASAHDYLYFFFDHTPARLALAEAAIQRALQLAPDAAEVHLALAQHFYHGREDFDRAQAEVALAQKTLPNSPLCFLWDAYIDRRQGRWSESIRKFQRSVELDPRNHDTQMQLALTYQHTRHYLESSQALDRILALTPKDQSSRLMKACNDLLGRADTVPQLSAVDSILKEDPGAARSELADSWLYVALCERDFPGARRAIAALAGGPIRWNKVLLNHDFLEGLLARVSGDAAAAQAAFTAARTEQEKLVAAQPDYGPAVCALGLIDAGLGRKEDALREGRRAIELLPVTKDSVAGALMIKLFALMCAWVGEKDVAFEQLAKAAQLPGHLHYGELQLHPIWDPLRGDPRFDKIVATIGPFSQP